MEVEALKCPNCGANLDIEEGRDFIYCRYCGTKVTKKDNSVKTVKVELVNNQFESALAEADNQAKIYFDKKDANIFDYNKVINCYSSAEKLGAQDNRLYLHLSQFFVKANSTNKECFFRDVDSTMKPYDLFMNLAIERESDDIKRKKLIEKYKIERKEFKKDIEKKIKGTSFINMIFNSKDQRVIFYGITSFILLVLIAILIDIIIG